MIRMTGLPCILVAWTVISWLVPAALNAQSAGHLAATARVLPAEPALAALTMADAAVGRPRAESARSRLPSVVVREIRADGLVAEAEPRRRLVLVEVNYLSN